jgi:hypothetical protein
VGERIRQATLKDLGEDKGKVLQGVLKEVTEFLRLDYTSTTLVARKLARGCRFDEDIV